VAGVYSTQFFSGTLAGGGSQINYTVPAGRVAVLRDVSLVWISGAPAEVFVGETGVAFGIKYVFGVGDPSPHWEGRIVYPAGTTLFAFTTAGSCFAMLSGYLLNA